MCIIIKICVRFWADQKPLYSSIYWKDSLSLTRADRVIIMSSRLIDRATRDWLQLTCVIAKWFRLELARTHGKSLISRREILSQSLFSLQCLHLSRPYRVIINKTCQQNCHTTRPWPIRSQPRVYSNGATISTSHLTLLIQLLAMNSFMIAIPGHII